MAKKRIKKSVKIILMFVIISIILMGFLFFYKDVLFEKPIYYDDQYIDGIVFTNMEYSRKTLKYCYHNLNDVEFINSNLTFRYMDEIVGTFKKSSSKCNSIEVLNKPENIYIYNIDSEEKSVLSTTEKEESFNKCNNEITFPYENNKAISDKKKELNSAFKDTTAGIYYEDIRSGFTYGYNADNVFYGASLIKLPEALYIVDEAIKGNISLEDTLTLTSYYYKFGNDGHKSHDINSQVSIGDLIKYMLESSDNGAHLLLYDSIAGNKLTSYEKSLGSTYLYNKNTDKFGSQTARATNVYLKHAYDLMVNNETYGPLLKEYMTNDFYNNLKLNDGIEVAHKYGYIDKNPKLHDIGVVFNKHP
ncbi:MAG: serine hydrolase, partial [Bacilli bacterium]|nr:serine hydrolase [Bacilli bacterium]